MYALSAYGTDGVLRAIECESSASTGLIPILMPKEVLSDEIQTTLRLLGVTGIVQLGPSYVNTSRLESETGLRAPRAAI